MMVVGASNEERLVLAIKKVAKVYFQELLEKDKANKPWVEEFDAREPSYNTSNVKQIEYAPSNGSKVSESEAVTNIRNAVGKQVKRTYRELDRTDGI